MDESNTDQAIVMGMPYTSNEFLSRVVRDHPDRLMGFAWVTDPKDEDKSVKQLTKAINEQSLKGLKLYPGVQGFTAADPEILPLIRKTVELDVPILIHSYPWPVGYFHHNLPEHIDVLKKSEPDTTIIIGHMGYQRFMDLLALAPVPGVYVETSGTLSMIAELYGIEFLTRFIRKIGVDNVVYGSDWVAPGSTMKGALGIIEKMDLTKEEKNQILGENIRRIMKL